MHTIRKSCKSGMHDAIWIYNREAVRRSVSKKQQRYMLLTGKLKQNITIQTPKGILFQTEILEITRSETEVTCAVRKDGGDDPDITSGTLIFFHSAFCRWGEKIPGQNNRQFSGIHVKAMQEKKGSHLH